MQDIRKIKIQAVPKNIELLKKLADYRVPALKSEAKKTNTAETVKYSIQELSPDKIQKGEIDPLKIDPNVYEVFSRNSGDQVLLDLNQDNQRKRYTINLQVSKFEDSKFNEIVDIEFEEFLPTRSVDDIIAELQQEIERLKIEKTKLEEQIKADKRLELELRKDINESDAEIERLELVIENARAAASTTQRVEQASKELESTKKEPRTALGRLLRK